MSCKHKRGDIIIVTQKPFPNLKNALHLPIKKRSEYTIIVAHLDLFSIIKSANHIFVSVIKQKKVRTNDPGKTSYFDLSGFVAMTGGLLPLSPPGLSGLGLSVGLAGFVSGRFGWVGFGVRLILGVTVGVSRDGECGDRVG